jgi:outer membrane protein TolC
MSIRFDQRSRFVSRFLLACAVSTVGFVGMTGCSSAMAEGTERETSNYTDMLIAKSIVDGSYGSISAEPTRVAGVKEMTRVDEPGPVTSPDGPVIPAAVPGTDPAVVPPAAGPATETQPASTRPIDVGLMATRLNEAEPVFNLSLQEAVARALKNSLAIKVEGYNPAIREALTIQAEAVFDPIVFAQMQYQRVDEPVLIPGSGLNGHTLQSQLGIRQLLPTGATAELSAGNTFRDLDRDGFNSATLRSSNTANLNFTVTQPLLRGFGADVTNANIFLAQRDVKASQAVFKRQVITTVADVEAAYHNLVLGRTVVDIQERLLVATEATAKRVWDRRFIDADAISIAQSRAAVEARRAELIRARVNLRNQSDTLKALMNDPETNIRDNTLINPTDRPTTEPVYVSTAAAIETALRQRTELQEQRYNIEKTNIIVQVAKNDLLPKLDLTLSAQSNGLDRRFDQAFESTVSPGQYINFTAGFRLEFAIGNREKEAEWKRRRLERSQAMTQFLRIAQTVVQDVKVQLRDMLSSQIEIQAREAARIRAAQELEAITQKEDGGIVALTPEFLQLKLDSQSRLASAEQNLIQSMINYNIAIMRFEQAKGTLLEFNRISIDRMPIARYSDDQFKVRLIGQTYLSK